MPSVNASLWICNWIKALLCPSSFRKRWLLARLLVFGLFFVLFCHTMLFYPAKHSSLNEAQISFVLTPSNSSGRNSFLVVFVLSRPKNSLARETIRKTWAQRSNTALDCKVVFLLGKTNDVALQHRIELESEQYGDILQGNLPDTYQFLLLKVILALRWSKMMNFRYVVKTDDDLYVNIPALVRWFQENDYASRTKTLYAGKVLWRNHVSRYNILNAYPVSFEDYEENHYPPYCIGGLYIMSGDFVSNIVDNTAERHLFPVEDAYIGVAAKAFGLTPVNLFPHALLVHNKNRWNRRDTDECNLRRYIAIGDGLKPADLIYVHRIVSQPVDLSSKPICGGSVFIVPPSLIHLLCLTLVVYVFLSESTFRS